MWFIEIFTDLDSRARVFAILLAAGLGFAGVAYTQSKTKERENKAHRRSKYEEIVTDINDILFKSFELRRARKGHPKKDFVKESELEVAALAHKLDMLLSIYAPYITVTADKNNPSSNKVIDLVSMFDGDIELTRIKNTILTKVRELT
jgi:hypothetical protein